MSEEGVVGDKICTFAASDQDSTATVWGQHTYRVVSAEIEDPPADVTSYFTATTDSNIGTLELQQTFDNGAQFSPTTLILVVVEVTDGGNATDLATITVNITDVNKPPTCTASQVFNVNENSDLATVVGLVLAEDPDSNPFTAEIISGDNEGMFALHPTTRVLTVDDTGLNYEAIKKYSLAIALTDNKGASSTCFVTVNINDVNEPTTFLDQVRNVDENIATGALTASGTAVASITYSDPDEGDQAPVPVFTITYRGSESDNPISVNSQTGQLMLKDGYSLNYESTPNVYVYDMTWSSRGVTEVAVLTINVNNLPEPPAFVSSSLLVAETATGSQL